LLASASCYTIGHVIDTYTLLDRVPTPGEHRRLAEAVGWAHAFEWETMPVSLRASLAGVVALEGGQAIGMGRLVGDGVKYFYVQDLAVLPAHQGHGIGTALLHRLLDHAARTAPATAFVGLFAADGAVPLYQREGFTPGDMTGMFRLVKPSNG
jgi:GNAT superfamily N-acetyltransferase